MKDKAVGAVVTLITALVCFYFGSFASEAQVESVEAKVFVLGASMKEYYAKKTDVKVLETKLTSLKEGQKDMKDDLKDLKTLIIKLNNK